MSLGMITTTDKGVQKSETWQVRLYKTVVECMRARSMSWDALGQAVTKWGLAISGSELEKALKDNSATLELLGYLEELLDFSVVEVMLQEMKKPEDLLIDNFKVLNALGQKRLLTYSEQLTTYDEYIE